MRDDNLQLCRYDFCDFGSQSLPLQQTHCFKLISFKPLSFIKPPQDLRFLDHKATSSQKVSTAFSG